MKLFFKVKNGIKKQALSLEDFFKAYNDKKRLSNTLINFPEFENVVMSIIPYEKRQDEALADSIADAWDVFEKTSDDRINYKHFIARVNESIQQDAKAMKNIRNF